MGNLSQSYVQKRETITDNQSKKSPFGSLGEMNAEKGQRPVVDTALEITAKATGLSLEYLQGMKDTHVNEAPAEDRDQSLPPN